jgi:hypothetical protein
MITTNIDKSLKDIAASLLRIANALEEQNKPKGLGSPNNLFGLNGMHGLVPCVSKEEVPLPTPWNTDSIPTCDGDCICGKDNIDNL